MQVGPASLHLDLTLATWAADGLLAIFFFVAGLELKREFVAGDLREPRGRCCRCRRGRRHDRARADLRCDQPRRAGGGAAGWAIPTATDIAFALAVLAVIGSCLPDALRTFLLTLAVVDDLLAITIIALFYTDQLAFVPLLLALLPLGAFAVLVQRRVRSWWLLLPLAAADLGARARVRRARDRRRGAAGLRRAGRATRPAGPGPGLAEHFEHRWRPLSAGVAVPVFAFFAAGVAVGGGGLGAALTDAITIGIIAGLVAGKTVGIMGATWRRPAADPGAARRRAGLERRPRALAARRDRVHRLPAHRRAGLRHRQRRATTT